MHKVLLLGTNHPAVPTFELLIQKGWCCGLIMPPSETVGDRNDALLALAKKYDIPYSFDVADIPSFSANIILAANYPRLIPLKYLENIIALNTHWSLLPRWRGVHPTAWAMLNDDENIGFSIHFMEKEFDTGDLVYQASVKNSDTLTLLGLHRDLAQMQADGVQKVLEIYEQTGNFPRTPQNHALATYAAKRLPRDGLIHWNWPARRVFNLVRVLPEPQYPGAFTFLKGRKLIIVAARPCSGPSYWTNEGQVVCRSLTGVWVKCADTCVEIEKLRWVDETEVQNASSVLKMGDQLGI